MIGETTKKKLKKKESLADPRGLLLDVARETIDSNTYKRVHNVFLQ